MRVSPFLGERTFVPSGGNEMGRGLEETRTAGCEGREGGSENELSPSEDGWDERHPE